ncbi:MAG: hypothetical protein QOF96_1483, partial [Actinomycetota bacterium]|nr:hypothetical protein [Actinomycetota bacterium]
MRSVADRSGEHQRRAEAAWHRAEQLGAVLGVGRTIQVGDEVVEVVATLADATQTVVVYRAPVGSDLFPSPVDPPGGASGGTMGDLLVAHLPPAEGSTVLVNFGDFDDDGHEVELPIDRARTQPHERQAVRLPPPLMDDGARVAIRGAVTGLLMATIDLEVSSEDPALTAAGLGTHGSLPQPHRRAGSGALWRDWFPPPEPLRARTEPNDGEETRREDPPQSSWQVQVRFAASATAKARLIRAPKGQGPAPTPAPPKPWEVRALPGCQLLAIQGWGSGGGPVPDALFMGATLQFDPPPDEAAALELIFNELLIFRRCSGDLVEVPGPRSGDAVDLRGRSLTYGSERIDLIRWEPRVLGSPQLVVRPSRPGLWPDIRVVADNTSVSLWLRPNAEGELAGALPGM